MKQIEVNVGADPEFVICNGDKILDASLHRFVVKQFGSMGNDGHKFIAELRPNFSKNPLDVVYNMREIMSRKISHDPEFLNYDFHAGSSFKGKRLGGHIHFSIDGILTEILNFNIAAEILDNYLGIFSILLEDSMGALNRRKIVDDYQYGFASDWRNQPEYGGFEYRSCSSWLVSPHVSAAFLCLGKIILYEILNNPGFSFKTYDCGDDFIYVRKTNLLNRFDTIWTDIQNFKLYPCYRPYIDLLYILVRKNLTWFPKVKLKEAWGIVDIVNKTFKPKILQYYKRGDIKYVSYTDNNLLVG